MKVIVCFFLLIALGGYHGIFAAETSSKAGEILRNFKLLEREMIFESDRVLLTQEDKDIFSTYKKLGVYESIGDKVQSKREYLESQNRKIIGRANSLQSSVAGYDEDIKDLVEEINSINGQIVSVKDKIETNKKTIDILKKKISENTQVLLDYMVYLYKKGESVSLGNDIDNLKTILLSPDDIDEVLSDLYFTSIIQVTGQQLIEKHRDFISELYVKKVELGKDEDQLKALRKSGVLEKNILDDKRAAKQRLLEITKGQEELYKKYISEKLDLERDIKVKELRERISLNNTKRKLLENYNCEFIDIASSETLAGGLSQQCLDINKIIYAESRITGTEIGNNPLEWPIKPYLGVSAFYRDSDYIAQFGEDHDAIDIVAPQGTEIIAPMDGYVIYLQPPVNTGYAYVALKHSDGLVTLFGHINKSLVAQYDFVKQGEAIAISGGEYGTDGAGVLSTGPHLHFAVYKDEEYVDPLEYLDTSFLDFNNIPERYTFKYYSDFRSRKGYEYKNTSSQKSGVFRIEGDTEIERQKYLLNTYAVGDFRNWDMWVEESVSEGLDPTFVMCVALAETTLGKYLKTSYNIGNVGNTDSGSTYSFSSARQGVNAMVSLTFNNKYLSQYNEIQQLSRYGNKDLSKPIYASSDFNWHNNIIKCMSHVKGSFIPDSYNFRISR